MRTRPTRAEIPRHQRDKILYVIHNKIWYCCNIIFLYRTIIICHTSISCTIFVIVVQPMDSILIFDSINWLKNKILCILWFVRSHNILLFSYPSTIRFESIGKYFYYSIFQTRIWIMMFGKKYLRMPDIEKSCLKIVNTSNYLCLQSFQIPLTYIIIQRFSNIIPLPWS